MTHFGELIRGEFNGAALTANIAVQIPLFDKNGNVRVLAVNERLFITDAIINSANATTIQVFFDVYADAKPGQLAAPTLAAGGAGTGIAAGTYSLGFTFVDANTGRESALSTLGNVTPTIGQQITVTAPVALPAWNPNGFIKVYRSDGGGTGFVAQGAAGSNSVVLTSVAVTGSLPTLGSTAQGKVVALSNNTAGTLSGLAPVQPDGIVGPPGVNAFVVAGSNNLAGSTFVQFNGRIIPSDSVI